MDLFRVIVLFVIAWAAALASSEGHNEPSDSIESSSEQTVAEQHDSTTKLISALESGTYNPQADTNSDGYLNALDLWNTSQVHEGDTRPRAERLDSVQLSAITERSSSGEVELRILANEMHPDLFGYTVGYQYDSDQSHIGKAVQVVRFGTPHILGLGADEDRIQSFAKLTEWRLTTNRPRSLRRQQIGANQVFEIAAVPLVVIKPAIAEFILSLTPDSCFVVTGGKSVPLVAPRITISIRTSADIDRSGKIDSDDLVRFVASFSAPDPSLDIDGDGEVDVADLRMLTCPL